MGRPKIYDEPRIATAIRLPAKLRDELQSTARDRDVSVNLLVTRAVSDYLRRLPPLPPLGTDEPVSGLGSERPSARTAS